MLKMKLKTFVYLLLCLYITSCSVSGVEEPVAATYSIAGHIIDSIGNPIDGVQLFYGKSKYTTSDADGQWSISNLVGKINIKPKKENYIFNIPEIEVTKTDTNIFIIATNNNPITQEVLDYQETLNWLQNMQLANGLLESAENTNFVSLYDNALAALVFIQQEEYKKAEKIFDYFNGNIHTELVNGTGGFYQFRNKKGENGNRTWIGDNAWLLIALNHYHDATENQKYQFLATELEKWLRFLQDTDGGIWGGYKENGERIHKVTEGIITAFNAVKGYDNFHKNILGYLKENRWSTNEKLLVAWPENPAYYFAMDLHPLGYGVFEDYPENSLEQANKYLNTQTATLTGKQVTGYCFDEDKDVIWLEGNGQMAVAYAMAKNVVQKEVILKEIEKTLIKSTIHENSEGIPYATNLGTGFGTSLLWDHASITPAISATAWYIFAKMSFNPLEIGRLKNIPEKDKFWIQEVNN